MQRIVGSWRRYFNFVWDFLMECFEKIVSVIQENELIRLAFLCTVVPVCLWFVLSIFLELPYSFNVGKYNSNLEYASKYRIPRHYFKTYRKKYNITNNHFHPQVSSSGFSDSSSPNTIIVDSRTGEVLNDSFSPSVLPTEKEIIKKQNFKDDKKNREYMARNLYHEYLWDKYTNKPQNSEKTKKKLDIDYEE